MAVPLDSRAPDAPDGQPRYRASVNPVARSGLANRLPGWVRPPTGIVDRTRWLFVVLVVASLVLAVPGVVVSSHGTARIVAVVAGVVFAASLATGYHRRRAPLVMDLVDAAAVMGLTLAGGVPAAVFPVVFAALWFRSQYGSLRRGMLRAVLFVGAIAAAMLLSEPVSGPGLAPLIPSIPTMLLTVIVAQHLAGAVMARERAASLEAVHGSLGANLLATTDAGQIREIAWAAIARVCELMTGVRAMKVVSDGRELRVVRTSDGFARVPTTLPPDLLAALVREDGGCQRAPVGRAALDAAAGARCQWVCVPLPVANGQAVREWLLVGSPGALAPEAVASLTNLTNQVTLALRNSEVHRDLTTLSEVDALTGLANRATFNTALARDLQDSDSRETTVLFLDLDDFKDVNDVHGHHTGDELLRVVAARLSEATRPRDLCARIGGDEFAVLLRDTGEVAAAQIAQRVVEVVSAPANLESVVVRVGASVGSATVVGADDPETLLHRADVAMYSAKAQGKARVQVFEPGLLHGDPDWVVFERALTAASANRELVVHYQPVVSLMDGRCTAVEALVRWQHPERGLLAPDTFIEAAERIGAIGAIGTAVLRQTLADASAWRSAYSGIALPVHVNVSALQLDDDSFVNEVASCLRDFDWPPDRLVLEFTETIVISSPQAIGRLRDLSASGVVIAIDDFGTGYSSLTTLRTLPVQVVKIDRSFIAGSTTSVEDRAVTEAIATMVARMGLRAIAEGVERPEQRDLLVSVGVHEAQGFLYLRPQPAEDFAAWLGQHLPSVAVTGRTAIPFVARPA
jgi:diguanylate cyclase (GGDEF)-like protein